MEFKAKSLLYGLKSKVCAFYYGKTQIKDFQNTQVALIRDGPLIIQNRSETMEYDILKGGMSRHAGKLKGGYCIQH